MWGRRFAMACLVVACLFVQACGRGCPAIYIPAINVDVTHADGTPDPGWTVFLSIVTPDAP